MALSDGLSLPLNVQLAGACGHIEAKWRVVEVKVLARHCGVECLYTALTLSLTGQRSASMIGQLVPRQIEAKVTLH